MTDEQDLHVMQLAAISTASIQNTETSIKDRIGRENPYWTTAYGDVCAAVDREMELIAENNAIKNLLAKCSTTCIYCGLEDMSKCARGFPGCAKADDIMCGEDEALRDLLAANRTLHKAIQQVIEILTKQLQPLP